MIRFFWGVLIITFLFSCKQTPYPNAVSVKIIVDTEEPLPENEKIFLTGNQSQLGFWNPQALPMTRRSETRWEKKLEADSAHIEFKFTLGSFEREAISNNGVVPANAVVYAARDTEVYFVIEDWKNPHRLLQTSFGKIESFVITPSNGLKSRKIDVLLPEGYDQNTSKNYPVLYLHDGQHQYDSTFTFNNQEWKIDETLKELTKVATFDTPICIAISNTEDRNKEYGDLTKESKYHEFIVTQLKPLIDSMYRTLSDRKNTATMGASMGGLVAFSLAWYHDDVFSKAACFSPAFKVSAYDIISVVKNYSGDKKDLSFYFYNGSVGLEEKLQPGLTEMKDILSAKGYQIEYYIAQGAEHNEAAWSKQVAVPLKMFFGK